MDKVEILLISDEHPDRFLDMPGGLSGYWWETEHLVCVPFVTSKIEGSGAFSRFLGELEVKGKIVFFSSIISAKLDTILRKRGYVDAVSKMSELERKIYGEEYCDGLAKRAK